MKSTTFSRNDLLLRKPLIGVSVGFLQRLSEEALSAGKNYALPRINTKFGSIKMLILSRELGALLVGVLLAGICSGCATSNPGRRAALPKKRIIGAQAKDVNLQTCCAVLKQASGLIESGLDYYEQNKSDDILDFATPVSKLLDAIEILPENAGLRAHYIQLRERLMELNSHQARKLVSYAETHFAIATRTHDLLSIELAERALLKSREFDPSLEGQTAMFLRKVQAVRRELRRELGLDELADNNNSMFGPGVYPGAKYWGLILVYAYA